MKEISSVIIFLLYSCYLYNIIFLFSVVPCAPKVTSTHLDCYTNAVLLQWTPINGSVSYTADARTPGGLISTCSSNSTNCELRGLACGQTYNLTMVSYDGHCHSQPGTAMAVASGMKEEINSNAAPTCSNIVIIFQESSSVMFI